MIKKVRGWIKKSRGFTLVETIMATTAMAVLFSVAYPALINALNHYEVGLEKANLHENLRNATNDISRRVRQAIQPNPPDPPYALIFTGAGDDENKILQFTGSDGHNYQYYLDANQQILLDKDGAGHNVVASGVESVYFELRALNGDEVGGDQAQEVYFKLTSSDGYILETTVVVRSLIL